MWIRSWSSWHCLTWRYARLRVLRPAAASRLQAPGRRLCCCSTSPKVPMTHCGHTRVPSRPEHPGPRQFSKKQFWIGTGPTHPPTFLQAGSASASRKSQRLACVIIECGNACAVPLLDSRRKKRAGFVIRAEPCAEPINMRVATKKPARSRQNTHANGAPPHSIPSLHVHGASARQNKHSICRPPDLIPPLSHAFAIFTSSRLSHIPRLTSAITNRRRPIHLPRRPWTPQAWAGLLRAARSRTAARPAPRAGPTQR